MFKVRQGFKIASFFESGPMPTKSQNTTILGLGIWLATNDHTLADIAIGALCLQEM